MNGRIFDGWNVSACGALLFGLTLLFCVTATGDSSNETVTTENIRIRDPFIVVDKTTSTYYLYAQAGNRKGSHFSGVEVYVGKDLKNWSKPVPVLTLPKEIPAIMVWAPEVHRYKNKWYMFVTLTFKDLVPSKAPFEKNWPPMYKRGTWIFQADSPLGPFEPIQKESYTPADWMALDGTLWQENGKPYMIFCHEWVQTIDGTIDVVELTDNLSGTLDKPKRLFSASSAPGSIPNPQTGKVTDGPFLYQSQKRPVLNMIWSTFLPGKGYCVLVTCSEKGINGPWSTPEPLFTKHGGHGMIFTSLDGRLLLALHQPEIRGKERLQLIELTEGDNGHLLPK